MKHIVSEGIVPKRTDYGEAYRIINLLTSTHGKLTGITKGVRNPKSKLAGGIELFSVSEISFLEGRSDIKTITATRLAQHFGKIISSYERSSVGFEIIKLTNKVTDEQPENTYYQLLHDSLKFLDDVLVEPRLVELWFYCHLLRLEGRQPNLIVESETNSNFIFDFESMSFKSRAGGNFKPNHLKLMRVLSSHPPSVVKRLTDTGALVQDCLELVRRSYKYVS